MTNMRHWERQREKASICAEQFEISLRSGVQGVVGAGRKWSWECKLNGTRIDEEEAQIKDGLDGSERPLPFIIQAEAVDSGLKGLVQLKVQIYDSSVLVKKYTILWSEY